MAGPLISNLEGGKLHRTLERCVGNLCECLDRAIEQMLNNNAPHGSGEKGLKQHFAEQVQPGADGPGTSSWTRHENNITDQQKNMRDHLREHERRGCGGPGGGSPVPSDAWHWASRPVPNRLDWQANNPMVQPDYQGVTGSPVGDAAAAGIGGYLLYRGLRMLPSLLFPPSLIPNALAP